MLILNIDNREPSLIKEYFKSKTDNEMYKFSNLIQGDFIISLKTNEIENILLIIERKSIEDLLASVKDNRYLEQSYRYSQLQNYNCSVYYIIEGNINRYSKDSIEYKTVYSCIFSLSYKNKITVLQTINVQETINIIEHFYYKILKEVNVVNEQKEINNNTLVKKQTVTRENIDIYMLNLVPSIGLNTAKELLNNYNKSFYEFWKALKNSEIDLNKIKLNNRKLSKKVIENIKIYLF